MEEIIYSQNNNSTISCYSMDFSGISKQNAHGGRNVLPKMFVGRWWYFLEKCWKTGWSEQDVRDRLQLPCPQFINVSQRALHIYWQFSAMSHAIHKIVSKRRCQSYFISRRSPHHGKSKNRDLWASSQSRFLFCLCAAHCSRNFQVTDIFSQ